MSGEAADGTDGTDGPDFGVLLAIAFRAYVDRLHVLLAAQGFQRMRPTFGYTFRALQHGALAPGELAERLDISKQAVGKILDEMEDEGFVRREADPADGRQKRVRLTERGIAAWQAAVRAAGEIEAELRSQAGGPAVDGARVALQVLAAHAGSGAETAARRARPVW